MANPIIHRPAWWLETHAIMADPCTCAGCRLGGTCLLSITELHRTAAELDYRAVAARTPLSTLEHHVRYWVLTKWRLSRWQPRWHR